MTDFVMFGMCQVAQYDANAVNLWALAEGLQSLQSSNEWMNKYLDSCARHQDPSLVSTNHIISKQAVLSGSENRIKWLR